MVAYRCFHAIPSEIQILLFIVQCQPLYLAGDSPIWKYWRDVTGRKMMNGKVYYFHPVISKNGTNVHRLADDRSTSIISRWAEIWERRARDEYGLANDEQQSSIISRRRNNDGYFGKM